MDPQTYYDTLLLPEECARMVKLDTLPALEAEGLAKYAQLPALLWQDQSLTYAQFYAGVARARAFLLAQGLAPGAHVALYLRNGPLFAQLFFAVATLGRVAVLLPASTAAEDLPELLQRFDAALLLHDAEFAPAAEAAAAALPGLSCFEAGACTAETEAPADSSITPDTPAAILLSAGTTGRQKGVLLSHGNLMQGAWYGIYGWQRAYFQRYLLLVPLTHVFGLVRNLLTCLYTGSSLFINQNMREIFADLQKARPTLLVLVPALADMLGKFAAAQGVQALGGALSYIICGGAHVGESIIQSLHKLGIVVCPGYGLTETANLVSGSKEGLEYPASVGPPYPGEDVRIEDGVLWVKGPHVMQGYYGQPEETARVLQNGWFCTGDLARQDEEGRLYITGRAKNIIVLDNGENVSPEELEALLNALPFVQDSLVHEAQTPLGGWVLAAQVLPDSAACKALGITDAQAEIEQAVADINQGLPAFKQLAQVTVRKEDFPRNASLKIIRPKGRL